MANGSIMNMKKSALKHVGPEGALYTVRVGSPRLLSTVTLRWFADLADQYCDGHLRFTSRHNVEFLLVNPDNIDPLINVLEEAGWPVGGTGKSLKLNPHPRLGTLPFFGYRFFRYC